MVSAIINILLFEDLEFSSIIIELSLHFRLILTYLT